MITKAWATRFARTIVSVADDRDFDAYEELFHRDVVWRSPAFECVGARAVRRRHEDLLAAVPDYAARARLWAVDVLADRAVYKLVQSGTVSRDFVGTHATFRASAQPFKLRSAIAVQFDPAGLISEVGMYFDPADAGGDRVDRISP